MPHTHITGPNGFFGATVTAEELAAGHRVTGTVRSLKSAQELMSVHPEWDEKMIDFVEIAGFTREGVFDFIF